MPYEFQRSWANLERVFRPLRQFTMPSQLSEQVSLVYDPLDRVFTSGTILQSNRFNAGLVAGTNTVNLTPPPAGYFQIPVCLTAWHNEGANRRAQVAVVPTAATPADAWGSYNSTQLIIDEDPAIPDVTSVRLNAVPVPRGNNLQVVWIGMTGGGGFQYIIDFMWMLVPGELIQCEHVHHNTSP